MFWRANSIVRRRVGMIAVHFARFLLCAFGIEGQGQMSHGLGRSCGKDDAGALKAPLSTVVRAGGRYPSVGEG